VIAFLTVGFLTNYWGEGNLELGQAKYGTYTYIYDFLAMFGALADLGIFTIAVREMSQREEHRQEIFSSAISLRLITLIFALLLATVFAALLPQYAGTGIPTGVAITALGTGFFILSGTFSSILLIHLQMRFQALALVLGKILTFGLIVLIIFGIHEAPTTQSFYALLWAGVAGSFLTLIMTWRGARRFLQVKMNWNKPLMKRLFLTALPFGIATFISTIYFRLDITMMGIILPPSAADGSCAAQFCGDQQVGIYGVAVRVMEVIMILPLYFMNSILPTLSKSIARGEQQATERHLQLPFLFLILFALPATVGLFILAHPIVELVTPEGFG